MGSNNARWAPRAACLAAAVCLAVGVTSWGAPPEQGGDQIFFSKSFPRSKPEYFEITVLSTGKSVYREDPADDMPVEFTLSEEEAQEVFDLAEKLERFRGALQTDRKVAFTGTKTLRYTSAAGEDSEAQFTYSEDKDAQAILEWFEKAGETERHLIELERVAQFDRLGVNKALLLFQVSFDDGRVVAAQQFLPILKRIAAGSKFMHMARSRAASLAEQIEGRGPSNGSSATR